MVVIGGVIPPDDVPTLQEMGAAAVFLPGTVIADSALDLLAKLRDAALMAVIARRRRALVEGIRAGRRAAVARAITLVESSRPDHRVAARELLDRARGSTGRARPRVGISGVPGVGKSTFIEALGTHLTGRGPPGRRPRRRPVVGAHRRVGARRQDPDGVAVRRPARLHPALARRRAPWAASPGPPAQAMLVLEAAGVRRRAGRDGRRRAVRGHRRRDGRHVPVPHPRPHRRPAPGHQEGHPRDRRRDRGQQGRRRPRERGPGRGPRARRGAAARPRQRGVGAAGASPARGSPGSVSTRSGSGCWPTASTSARTGCAASAPASSSTSPGRWCATSSTSGCGARPGGRARSATRCAPRCCPGELPAPMAADRILAAYDAG